MINENEFVAGDFVKVIGEKRLGECGEVRTTNAGRVRVAFKTNEGHYDGFEWYENTELVLSYAAYQRLQDEFDKNANTQAELAALRAENARLSAEVNEYQLHKRCYAEGERASEIGVRHTENPYTWGTLEFKAWFGGWFVKRVEIDRDFSI